MSEDINSYFEKNFYHLDVDAIYELNRYDHGPINNVVSHLNERCYGVLFSENSYNYEYTVLFIQDKYELSGLALTLSLDLKFESRVKYTIEFCILVNDKYPNIDIVDAYNTLQTQVRSGFEKFGFFTIGNELDSISQGKNAHFIVTGSKGILKFPFINKTDLYRWIFRENSTNLGLSSKDKKVYLLFDPSNNLIKIGQSISPVKREKTLKGIDPNWELLTFWVAPASEEKELHKMFAKKNKRGEWFKLSFEDLKLIRNYMSKYEL